MDADIQTPGEFAQRTRGAPARLMGDERLALEVGAGSERAFTVLYRRYHQQLYRYCRGLTGTDQDAQDALQTTFTKALVALREGRRNAPLRPWLYRIAHNESISAIRARVAVAGKLPLELAANISASDRGEERERITTLVADLRELPEQQRGALVMRELSGLSHEEIAKALQISVGAAKQSILEARRSLLEFEAGRAMLCEDVQRIISDDDRRSLRSRRVRAHMRDCGACSAFAQAIPNRRADMLALWPVLPAATSAGLLAKITAGGAGSGHSGGGAGLAAGTAAKGIGATISVKAAIATGAAVLTTATVGAVAVLHPHTAAPPASHGALTPGHRLSIHDASVPGHGSAVTHAADGALPSIANHRAIGKRPGPAASRHAARQNSHGKGTTSNASAGSSTASRAAPGTIAPGQTRNYGHSGARLATATHHGPQHTAHGKPVKVNPSVAKKSTNPNVGHGKLKPRTHGPTHAGKPNRQPTKATTVTHTRTIAAVTHTKTTAAVTNTRTTAVTRTKATSTTTPAETKTTAAKTTKTTAATTTGKPTVTSTLSSVPATTTLTVSTSVAVTSSTPASRSVDNGVGNGGTPAGQSAGSSGGDKISK